MKNFILLPVSIVLVSILFCPIVMAGPGSMPNDLQMVEPTPSLPKELSAFFGKWESKKYPDRFFLIVEKIDEEKASLYVWRGGGTHNWPEGMLLGWERIDAKVTKELGKYTVWYQSRMGIAKFTLKGEYLDSNNPWLTPLRRVP